MTGGSFLFRHAMRYRLRLLAVTVLTLANAVLMLAVPWFAGRFLGNVVDASQVSNAAVAVLLVALMLAIAVLSVATSLISAQTAQRILADMRLEAYSHVQSLPLAFHEQHRQGDLLTLLTFEVDNLSSFLSDTLARAPSMVLTATGSVVLLFVLDTRVALVIPVLIPAIFLILRLVGRRMREIGSRTQEAEAHLLAEAEKNLETLAAIKAYVAEDHRRAAYSGLVEQARALALRNERIVAFLSPAIALVTGLSVIAIILLVTDPGGDGVATGELFSILLYAALLTRPMGALAGMFGRYQWAKGILARLEQVFAEVPEDPDAGLTPAAPARGALEFAQVEFAYPGREPTLCSARLSIAAGETIALTGRNGAGKSTMLKLAMRLYPLGGGSIRLDGHDIAGLSLRYLRGQFGYVPQRALLFNGTVRENIAFADPAADGARLERAVRLAQAEQFIAALPQGLDTPIGDHGVRLSGGQGQRIALARALLSQPPVLVLDEATAMFDHEAEAAFVGACKAEFVGRTVIIVTHRPASLALADRIIAVEDGGCRELSVAEARALYLAQS